MRLTLLPLLIGCASSWSYVGKPGEQPSISEWQIGAQPYSGSTAGFSQPIQKAVELRNPTNERRWFRVHCYGFNADWNTVLEPHTMQQKLVTANAFYTILEVCRIAASGVEP